ncbi:hypothetical protein ETB97_011965 [Aspergillus alliaceus]|uniref:Gamma-glutamylcyclotransferase AIG2-like domain-containing protein n=1 Tax=Petromyces alliaceus TaxID=209559 RepID=A0A5N6GB10_PETAA|nr:uncharacterized protein BDW43DRAFT_73893 [Aspergillus alliaceus]KAB8239158.1 hypothetical protein BDW43DRAFT_73893 [Aspergillus alliaceus]KAE8395782.1 hypothetical protein BDV23DRAFT_193580 [Aspergillus alliaceus]KAF5866413.1 hypothetical protein ETB97_011965 [Aspergillus burnettii]
MEDKPWYPEDYRQALLNTLTEEKLTELLEKQNCAPRFVYGVLMLPTVLKYIIEDQASDITECMTRAYISGYKLYQISPRSPPVVIRTSNPHDTVQGMVVFGLDVNQRNLIYDFEGGLMNLVDVRVQIRLKDSSLLSHDIRSGRTVDAGMFAWLDSKEGLIPVESTAWSLDGFLKGSFYENIAQSQRRVMLDGSRRI